VFTKSKAKGEPLTLIDFLVQSSDKLLHRHSEHVADSEKCIYGGGSANGFDELCGSDVEAVGQLDNVKQADVPFAPLYPTHVVAMQVGYLRQFLL